MAFCRSSDCGGGGDEWAGGGESEGDGDSGHGDGGHGDRVKERDDGDLGGAGGVITSWFVSFCGLGGVECDVSTHVGFCKVSTGCVNNFVGLMATPKGHIYMIANLTHLICILVFLVNFSK